MARAAAPGTSGFEIEIDRWARHSGTRERKDKESLAALIERMKDPAHFIAPNTRAMNNPPEQWKTLLDAAGKPYLKENLGESAISLASQYIAEAMKVGPGSWGDKTRAALSRMARGLPPTQVKISKRPVAEVQAQVDTASATQEEISSSTPAYELVMRPDKETEMFSSHGLGKAKAGLLEPEYPRYVTEAALRNLLKSGLPAIESQKVARVLRRLGHFGALPMIESKKDYPSDILLGMMESMRGMPLGEWSHVADLAAGYGPETWGRTPESGQLTKALLGRVRIPGRAAGLEEIAGLAFQPKMTAEKFTDMLAKLVDILGGKLLATKEQIIAAIENSGVKLDPGTTSAR